VQQDPEIYFDIDMEEGIMPFDPQPQFVGEFSRP
jgi:hypothetical protein